MERKLKGSYRFAWKLKGQMFCFPMGTAIKVLSLSLLFNFPITSL